MKELQEQFANQLVRVKISAQLDFTGTNMVA